MNNSIQVFRPVMNTDEILENLRPVLESGWIGLGPKTKEFEIELSKFIGVKYMSVMNGCTSALHLAIKILNLPEGSNVLTTPVTFTSTNNAILYERLNPVFCDVEKLTGNLDINFIEDAIKLHNIKAIMAVHIGGYSNDMASINFLSNKYFIPVIEDCAHSFGSKYNGINVGITNNTCCWSFQAVKNLPIGDGGALSTNDSSKIEYVNKLRWMGINKDTISRTNLNSEKQTYNWDYSVEYIGYKYHLNDILSTIGLVGLKYLNEYNGRRKYIAEQYLNKLTNCIKPDYKNNRESSYHFLPLFFENRDEIYAKLIKNNIFPGMHYKRNDLYEPFKNFPKVNNCENAEWYQNHELTLPIHLDLTNEELDFIINLINN